MYNAVFIQKILTLNIIIISLFYLACNVLLTSDTEVVTLRNHGFRRNCTLATAFPANFKILQLSVGIETKSNKFTHKLVQAGIFSRVSAYYTVQYVHSYSKISTRIQCSHTKGVVVL